jgi:hypothetical protein
MQHKARLGSHYVVVVVETIAVPTYWAELHKYSSCSVLSEVAAAVGLRREHLRNH